MAQNTMLSVGQATWASGADALLEGSSEIPRLTEHKDEGQLTSL